MEGNLGHESVLLHEAVDALNIDPHGVYVDATLGRAGHSLEIVKRLTTGRLIGVDRDYAALDSAPLRLEGYMDRVTLIHGNFQELDNLLEQAGVEQVNGVLFDLGVSSPQLDDSARGFSYMKDAPLDMRMDATQALTAHQVVNQWPREELKRILYEYGEERYAPAIADRIVKRREEGEIQTTLELAEIIRSAMPAAALREKQHPAKRSFQAIRCAVNGELEAIPLAIDAAVKRLAPGGRLAVISFHSLEDRLVKTAIRDLAQGCTCPPDFPVCVCGKTPTVKAVSRKPILPSPEEIERNPRARSAKLRVAEKL